MELAQYMRQYFFFDVITRSLRILLISLFNLLLLIIHSLVGNIIRVVIFLALWWFSPTPVFGNMLIIVHLPRMSQEKLSVNRGLLDEGLNLYQGSSGHLGLFILLLQCLILHHFMILRGRVIIIEMFSEV